MADFLTSIGDFFGLNKGQATQQAADKNAGLLSDLAATGNANLTQAKDNNQSLLDLFKPGAQLYADATGVNGAEGNARASGAFTTSPGYQFSQDQGIQALMRTAASRGEVGGGGLPIDLAKYVTAGANDQWGDWLSELAPYNGLTTNATQAVNGSLGDLTNFNTDITSGKISSNNQRASGAEAGQGGLWDLLGNVADVAGTAVGAATGLKGLGGYGTYAGGAPLRVGYQAGV